MPSSATGPASREPWEARLNDASAEALYVHVPFCASKCAYCDFASWATRPDDPLMGAYASSVARMVGEADALGLLEGCRTGYLGGGTPSLLGQGAATLARSMAGVGHVTELSCEANPDSLSDEVLGALVDAGVTRVSIGVQSTNDGELRLLGRIHTAREALGRLRAAVASGLEVSCDLMCATPGQTDASWRRSLSDVLACGVGHVSVYPLAIEEGTAFDRRYGEDEPWNSEDVQAERMEAAQGRLAEAGFHRYEVASYALPGRECRHNIAYWTGRPYLGLGTGASGMLAREGYERLRAGVPRLPELPEDVARVRLAVTSGRREVAGAGGLADLSYDLELLTSAQAAAEDLMLGMRLVRGVGPAPLAHARDVLGADAVDGAVGEAVLRGLAVPKEGGGLAPTGSGWLLGNELFAIMWDLAPQEVATAHA